MTSTHPADENAPYISTGRLPAPKRVDDLVHRAYERFRAIADGKVSDVYPTLAAASPDLFGLCMVETNGAIHTAGDWDAPFTIMSVSKPFVFALVCDLLGPDTVRDHIGVNATALPFNSIAAIERSADGRTNPMVNSGAIAVTSLVPGDSLEERWAFVREGLSRFAGRALTMDADVCACAMTSNIRNRAVTQLLDSYGRIVGDPSDALALYTRQCCLCVTAKDLAVMGATLAGGGVNPLTRARVIDPETCKRTLAVMAVAGLYETSGDWLYDVGLPGKSGIAGGLVTVSPGKGGMGAFSPPLDDTGNTVRGALAARFLSDCLGLSLFASQPEP